MRQDQRDLGPVQAGTQKLLIAAAGADLVADVVARFGAARFRALGSSMFPTIRSGDVLELERVAASDVHAGDIVVVQDGARLFAHRALGGRTRSAPGVLTRGDAHLGVDALSASARLIGRVSAIERGAKRSHAPFPLSVMTRVLGIAATTLLAAWRFIGARRFGLQPRALP